MFINWDVTIRFDPNSLEPSTKHGVPVPSYGNYGGPNYSAGVVGGTTPEGPNPTPAPVDALDTLFWQHDLVYQHVHDDPPQDVETVVAQADVNLVEGMYALTQTNLEPEALLYDAFATLSIAAKILTTPSELAYLEAHSLDQAAVVTAAQAAIPNFEIGLAETPGNEARSLNGAFHVFEAHFAQALGVTLGISKTPAESAQADYRSISSNFIATTKSAVSYSTADGFTNSNTALAPVNFSPPDNGLAIGDNGYIISVVNDTIGWTKDLSKEMKFAAFSKFFPTSLVGNMEFTDPQVLYDASNGKFIVTEELFQNDSTQSKILIAVSHDAQPTGIPEDWDFFSINSQYSFNGQHTNGELTAADYPQSDTDGVNLFITSDQFSGNFNYFGSLVTVIPLSAIENGPGQISQPPPIIPNTPIKETLDVAGNPGKGAFFVGYDGYSKGGNEFVTIGYYDDITQKTTFSTVGVENIDNLKVKTLVAIEPNGDLLDASDRRINDVKVIGNDLFAIAETVPNSPNSLPNVHWFDFDVSNPTQPVLKAEGDVPGSVFGKEAGKEAAVTTFNGSIAGDSAGNLVLNFTATGLLPDGSALFPGDFFAVHRSTDSTDPANFWEKPIQYAFSPTSYSDGRVISRWGDYSSAVVDPTQDHAFLISNEYAFDPSHWGTKIADLSLDSGGNAVKPAPADMLLASTATTPNTSGFVDGSIALLTQFMAAGLKGGFDNGSGGYTASPTPETIFGEAPLLTKPLT